MQNCRDQESLPRRRMRLNVWPVALRELREAARRPAHRRLRLCGAGVGLVLLWLILVNSHEPSIRTGSLLLGALHSLLLLLIFSIVPALAADSIAHEKRDGTLGLLFLTPLSASGIVAGKLLVQALRAFSLWLAVLPLLTIPFLTGGITWFDALSALSFEFCATVLCLGAGLLASSFTKERNSAFFLAFILAAVFLLLFAQTFQIALFVSWRGPAMLKEAHNWRLQRETVPIFTGLGMRDGFLWSFIPIASALLGRIWRWLCWSSPAITLGFLFVVGRFVAARIEHSWQDKVPSRLRATLFNPLPEPKHRRAREPHDPKFAPPSLIAPLFRRRFRRKMQRYLDRNPIAWLQQYSWKARLSKWCLCLLFLVIAFGISADSEGTRSFALVALLLVLAGFYTFVGVSGFLQEKRSGALELLLVTPLSAQTIILGRTWGLWKQFLPAALVVAGLFGAAEWQTLAYDGDWEPMMPTVAAIVLGGFLTLPVFATYSALRVKNLIGAAVLTWIALCMPAIFASAAVGPFFHYRPNRFDLVWMPMAVLLFNGVFAFLASYLLRHSLSRRLYSF